MNTRFRRVWAEIAVNLGAIALLPFIVGPVLAQVNWPLRALGLGSFLDLVAGRQYFSDIGTEVAAAAGMVSREHLAFDPITVLAPLIGMVDSIPEPHSHPPTSLVLWVPLTWVSYPTWLPFFALLSISVIAASMRLLDVPAWVAYPVAIGIGIHPDWLFGLVSTYPLTALAIAVAWRFRSRPGVAGAMYGLLAATRGFAGLLVLYPLVRRQWRAVAVAAAVVVATAVTAVALEPESVRGFLTGGRTVIESTLDRPDLFTVSGYAARHDLPTWLGFVPVVLVAAVALARRRDLFWVLTWASFAGASIAWMHTTIALIPLAVVIYRSGLVGRVIVLVGVGVILGPLSAGVVSLNVIWPAAVVLTGAALVLCPIRFDPGVWPNRASGSAVRAGQVTG